jgi:hypothetical protein
MNSNEMSAPVRIVPASLLRVRSFLGRRGGLKIRPWLGVAEALDEFSRALCRSEADESFWSELAELLGALTADLKERLLAEGKVVDNELLDPGEQGLLLAEIRRALAATGSQPGGYRDLLARLPGAASGLLIIMGTVAALGCGGSVDATPGSITDAAADHVQSSPTDAGTDADAQITIDAAHDAPADSAPPVDSPSPFDAACNTTGADLVALLVACPVITSGYDTQGVTNCVQALNDSWRTGLTELFACNSCDTIRQRIAGPNGGCFNRFCSDGATAGSTFDLAILAQDWMCPVYVGVRVD